MSSFAAAISLAALVCAAAAAAMPSAALAAEAEMLIILDCSNSMTDPLEGRTRFDVARDSMSALVDEIPEGTRVGLRAYSHRYEQRAESCEDTELLVPIGPVRKALVKDKVRALRCVGYTPIAFTLEAAARDFGRGAADRTIILLSDGKETCGGDPIAVARRLREAGLRITTQVIGFAVDAATRAHLEEIARAGGGRYWDAKGAAELVGGLKGAVAEAVKPAGPPPAPPPPPPPPPPPEPPPPAVEEFAAKVGAVYTSFYMAMGVEVLGAKGDTLELKDLKGGLVTRPKYLFFVPKKLDPAGIKVGDDVLATTYMYNHKPHVLHVGKVVESKEGKLRVARRWDGEIWVPADWIYEVPVLAEGTPVKLASVAVEGQPIDKGHPPEEMIREEMDGGDGFYLRINLTFPVNITFKVAGGPKEIRRVGICPSGYSHGDPGAAAPAQIELWAGASGPDGFRWTPVGLARPPRTSAWQFFRFPPIQAEYVHLRILKSQGDHLWIWRVRAYADDGPGAFPLAEILEPHPPVGAAGELERKAVVTLIEEEGSGGARYQEAKVLKKTGDKVIAITAAGKKITVDASKVCPLEPIDLAKTDLGDDVLVWIEKQKTYVRATVTETGANELKVQVGADTYKAKPDQLFKAPPAPE